MDFNNITLLPLAILLIVCSISDYKYNMIYNKHLLLIGTPIIFSNIIMNIMSTDLFSIEYSYTILSAISIAIVLYLTDIWAGGDFKLYIVIIFSLPVNIVKIDYILFNPLLFIIILSFTISLIYIIFESIYSIIIKKAYINSIELFKNVNLSMKRYFKIFLLLSYLNWLLNKVLYVYNVIEYFSISSIVTCIIIVFISNKTTVLENKYVILLICIVDTILCIINFNYIFNFQNLLIWFSVYIVAILRCFVNHFNYEDIPIEKLDCRMILSTTSSAYIVSISENKFNKISDESLKSRLTVEDVNKIKEISNEHDIIYISIVKKVPLALYISISTIIIIGSLVL